MAEFWYESTDRFDSFRDWAAGEFEILLYLDSNQVIGSIPPEIGQLANLEHLSLQSNQLTGSIPPEIGQLTKLTLLHLL